MNYLICSLRQNKLGTFNNKIRIQNDLLTISILLYFISLIFHLQMSFLGSELYNNVKYDKYNKKNEIFSHDMFSKIK